MQQYGQEVDSGPRVGNVVLLRVEPGVVRRVSELLEALRDDVPGRVAHVLQQDDGGGVFFHPLHHAPEGLAGFAPVVDALFLTCC